MYYAGFWQRFWAGSIDSLVLLVPMIVLGWLSSISQTVAIICAVPSGLLFWFYTFQLHAATGQTLGKRAIGIRVVRLDGTRIGRADSFRRSAVDLLFAVVWITSTIWTLYALPPSEFSNTGWFHQQQLITEAQPSFIRGVDIASQVWIWSEVFTMLFNTRKRAIHDFIAGTVVINENAYRF